MTIKIRWKNVKYTTSCFLDFICCSSICYLELRSLYIWLIWETSSFLYFFVRKYLLARLVNITTDTRIVKSVILYYLNASVLRCESSPKPSLKMLWFLMSATWRTLVGVSILYFAVKLKNNGRSLQLLHRQWKSSKRNSQWRIESVGDGRRWRCYDIKEAKAATAVVAHWEASYKILGRPIRHRQF